MRKQPNSPSQPQEANAQKAPGQGQLTFYDVMRMQNCKTYKFRKNEMYPSIRPPISRCCNDQAAYYSEAMKASGCGILDPQILNRKFDQVKTDNLNEVKKNVTKRNERISCINRIQRRGGPLPPEALEYANLSPYEVMRLQNCKAFRVLPCETYPNIRPPVSRCSKVHTAEWVADAVEDIGCDRYFDMEKDDAVDVWKQSPNKHTLSYYGVSTEIAQPEAILFNQAISKSLNKATEFKRMPPKAEPPKPPPKLYMTWPCGGLVLNRPLLKAKLTRMPTVQRKINASEALNWLHCPHPVATEHPFLESARRVKLQAALDMEKKAPKQKHGLRRKYMYCTCDIPENECTTYEWFKYRGDPKPIDKAFKEEPAKLEKAKEPEPKNYDELYSELVGCFEKVSEKDSLCAQYEICCKKPSKHGLGDDDGTGDGIGGGGHPGKNGHHPPTGSQANGSDEDEGGLKPGKKFKKKGDGDSDENGADKDNSDGKELDKDKGEGGDGDKDGDKEKGDKDKDKDKDKGKGKGKPGKDKKDKDKKDKDKKDKDKKDKDKKDKDNADNEDADLDDGTGKPGKGKKEKPDKEKTDKEKPDKAKPDKEKPDKEKPDKEKPDKEKTDKPNEKPGTEGYSSSDDEYAPKKGQDKGKEKPQTDDTVKEPEELPSFAGTPENETQEKSPPVAPVDSTIDLPDDTPEKPKDKKKPPKGKHHRPKKPKGNKDDSGKEPRNECPCEICEFMDRRRCEEDTPLIRQMKQDEKRRQLRDYYKTMQHREYEKCRDPVYRAPQHKCDPIFCDDCFCSNPKLGEYCDCLDAMQQLQKLLGPKHCIVNNELIFNVKDLRQRICKRFCDCIQCPRHE